MKNKPLHTFAQGVTWACARIIDMHREPGVAVEILRESGVDVNEAEPSDRRLLKRAMRQEQPK